jgi:hypothetical protein
MSARPVAALIGLGGDRKLVVILGGDGKGQDFSPLVGPVSRFARSVHLIGRDAAVIERTLQPTGVSLNQHPSLEEAVRAARRAAQPGDAVLLSPACASLDMFRNYEHRANVFLNEVRAIALDEGASAGVSAMTQWASNFSALGLRLQDSAGMKRFSRAGGAAQPPRFGDDMTHAPGIDQGTGLGCCRTSGCRRHHGVFGIDRFAG